MEGANTIVLVVLLISVTNVFSQAISRDLPTKMDPTISRIIRKVLRSPEEMDDDGVRRLQRGHFFSKTIMPSLIPGQEQKCWDRCEPGEVSVKDRLGLQPHQAIEKTKRNHHHNTNHHEGGKQKPPGNVKMTISFPKDGKPMMLTAMLMPISKT